PRHNTLPPPSTPLFRSRTCTSMRSRPTTPPTAAVTRPSATAPPRRSSPSSPRATPASSGIGRCRRRRQRPIPLDAGVALGLLGDERLGGAVAEGLVTAAVGGVVGRDRIEVQVRDRKSGVEGGGSVLCR